MQNIPMSKSEAVKILKENTAKIRFIKADKTERTITASLQPEYTKFTEKDYQLLETQDAPHLLRVYSVEDNGFRTVNLNTVSNFNVLQAA